MGPKKGKEVLTENSWRTIIEEAQLDEENWKVKVVLIEAAGSDQDRLYLNKFEAFAPEEKRFVIKNICKTETIFMINQLGGEKKVKDDNLRVFEEAQAFLKDKKDIPPDYLALVIKYLIIKMKDENLFIKRQRLEVKEGMKRESLTMVDRSEVRGTVNVVPPEPVEPPPPPKKGKGKEQDTQELLPEPDEGKKYNTLLRVRGEEWRDKVYVDDYPIDGPNLYVAVTGFVDALLPTALVKIGIPLTAIVQVRIDASTTRIPSALLRPTKRGQSQTDMLTDKSFKFWEDLQALRINKETAADFKGTACIIFSPPYWDAESLSGNPEKIYDELCYLMYDVQDLSRQHGHYLENLDIIPIPDSETDSNYDEYYHRLIDSLPLESTNMFSIIDSILQTVCKWEMTTSGSTSTTDTMLMNSTTNKNMDKSEDPDKEKIEKAENLVKDIFSALCKTEESRKTYRLTYGEEFETHRDPVVLKYGDHAKTNTFHLGNINMDYIVWSSLLNMPLNNLWNIQTRPEGENEAKINFHVNILLSCFEREDVETAELNRLIHILGCRKLFNNRSSLKKKHLSPSTITEFKKVYLKRSILAEPLHKCPSSAASNTLPSFPSVTRSNNNSSASIDDDDDEEVHRIKFLFDCPDISELVSAVEIVNKTPVDHLIDDFDYFEDFNGICAFQMLFDVFNQFNCVDYKYCEVTDSILLMFYNSHDNDGISREEWRCHLATPLCLQDFFDYVLEECYDWIEKEENIYNEKIDIKTSSEKVLPRSFVLNSCIEDTEVDADLLMEGSLKYQEITQLGEECEETTEHNMTTDKTFSVTTTIDSDAKSSKKSKGPQSSTPKLRQSRIVPSEIEAFAVPDKPFFGYDLGDRRVEVFGKDATYFSKDGTRIKTAYTLIIPMNIEYIILNVVPGDHPNTIWVHKALGEGLPQEILDSCESFRITTKDHVMINIKKETYEVPLPVMSMMDVNNVSKMQTGARSSTLVDTILETKSYYGFTVTWPNGLITESVHENNAPEISHIKQYYVNPISNLKEDMRCISLNGEVIIFYTSGIIEVLKPDGACIKITHAFKKVVIPADEEDITEASSEKSKKGSKSAAKDIKSKDKQSKASKTSKTTVELEEKPLQYELVIEEFETIDTSGLRQKWLNENSYDIEKLLIRTATDYTLGEIFSRRMDGTHILLNKDGTQIVTFPDKTRIITNYLIEDEEIYPEWTFEEKEYFDMLDSDSGAGDRDTLRSCQSQKSNYDHSISAVSFASKKIAEEEEKIEKKRSDGYVSVQVIYTIEHANFTTVTINKATGKISVHSPNETTVNVDTNNNFNIILDKLTSVDFDGEHLKMSYEACPACSSFTTCDIKIKSDDLSSVTKVQQNWLTMKDSFCKKVVVNEEGSITMSDDCSEEMLVQRDPVVDDVNEGATDKTETTTIIHGKCREMYHAKTVRFFVMQRDLSCSELVHRAILEQYKKNHRWLPWYSTHNCNSFGDNRSLLSILVPVHITETEKWLMESKLADKPKYLTYKDLKKDCGKGFYHWMRPYERFKPKPMKPENVLLPRLPRAFIIRTLEQQWKESNRDTLKGAKELVNAILKYRRVLESDSETLLHVPIIDLRPESERHIDDMIQALSHRVYEDLKRRLASDVESRTKADITTKQATQIEESVEAEESEAYRDALCKSLDEERESQIRQSDAAEGTSSNLKRYWRTRAEEKKEEEFYKYLLREGSVPPYFRNVLGGAIWWEINNTAADAVVHAERRKMKCVCADEASNEEMQPFM